MREKRLVLRVRQGGRGWTRTGDPGPRLMGGRPRFLATQFMVGLVQIAQTEIYSIRAINVIFCFGNRAPKLNLEE